MTSDKLFASSPLEDVAIIVPVFNDWQPLCQLLGEIDTNIGSSARQGQVVVVDDGSYTNGADLLRIQKYANIRVIHLVRLLSNQGHQRAIAIGIVHLVLAGTGAESVIVMDGDGEDRPEHISRLLHELYKGDYSVVFARRTQRSERVLFRLLYSLYRLVYWLLLGVSVRWGNFSAMRASALPVLAVSPDLWNHYAASVTRSRLRFGTVGLPRGKRYSGESHMNYTNLVIHGLSSIAASSEVLGARLLIALSALLAFFSFAFGVEVAARLWTHVALPNIAIAMSLTLAGLTMQGIVFTLLFTLIVLHRRTQAKVIPLRDAQVYIGSVEQIVPAGK